MRKGLVVRGSWFVVRGSWLVACEGLREGEGGAAHGEVGGAEDVQLVDLKGGRGGDGPSAGRRGLDDFRERVTPFFREFL